MTCLSDYTIYDPHLPQEIGGGEIVTMLRYVGRLLTIVIGAQWVDASRIDGN
ncbi:MAG: hypothetical protein JW795_03895 [Chitinivibrionales bacterium]|nr:hypothetical protein [Chitinivibrionales bacterium]